MKTTVGALSVSLATLLLAAAPALEAARITANHNETLVRDRARKAK